MYLRKDHRKTYRFSDDQRGYIYKLLSIRGEEIREKLEWCRPDWRRRNLLTELGEIYAIIHELFEEVFKPKKQDFEN